MNVSIGQASTMIGVSISTLRQWEREGEQVPDFRTFGGHRRYSILKLRERFNLVSSKQDRLVTAYARVSSADQKEDLVRQKKRLDDYCKVQNEPYEVIDDLGSGLNYKKRGLKKLIKLILSGKVKKIVLTHKDRLLRFGSEIIFYLCSFFNTEVEILEEDKELSDNERLAFDVVEIITVFSARLYGRRAHQNKKRAKVKSNVG